MTTLDFLRDFATPQHLLLILPSVLIVTLTYAMVSLWRSGRLVGNVDSEEPGVPARRLTGRRGPGLEDVLEPTATASSRAA